MKVLTWNLEWARPGSVRERIISEMIANADADLICLTEAYRSTLPPHGHVIEAGKGNRVADRKGARKALLWSRNEWDMGMLTNELVPPGRFVIGTTSGHFGPLRVVGMCIPWSGSNTPQNGGVLKLWEDHLSFIAGLKEYLDLGRHGAEATLLVGDFNQRLPRVRQPIRVAEALETALSEYVAATRNFRGSNGDLTIDHFCHSPDLRMESIDELPMRISNLRLSDHFGLLGSIGRA